MEVMEIVLLIAGGIIFILSFLIPDKKSQNGTVNTILITEEVNKLVSKEFETIKGHVDEVVEEAVTYAIEKTERSLERLSNEKIMAVSEYSETVLSEIHKNHEEAMFLYDMLNSKHINLKNTVSEVNRTVKEAEETVTGIRKFIPKQVESVDEKADESAREPELSEERFALLQAVVPEMGNDAEMLQPTETATTENGASGRNNNEKILELYGQGMSDVDIAKELGLGIGEVRLVIGLFKNQ